MRLPDIELDDRDFADLVREARSRVAVACPEWSEQAVSDPGLALIEAFAWLTDVLIYRVNRVPDKLHVRLLELLGVQLEPPNAASTKLRFMLQEEATESFRITAHSTEVGAPPVAGESQIAFQVAEDVTIPPARLAAFATNRGDEVTSLPVVDGRARPRGGERMTFGEPPQPNDALFLGFDAPLANLVVKVNVDCAPARRVGGDPENPPLMWEVSTSDRGWEDVEVLEDTTGGFERGAGTILLQIPANAGRASIGTRHAHWVRCRVIEAGVGQAVYTHAPQIYELTASPVGALVPAAHAVAHSEELLGTSDGTAGQTFRLHHVPVLAPSADERLEVRPYSWGSWEAWEPVESFAESTSHDRHYLLDRSAGVIEFGPAVRNRAGIWQHGAVPPPGAMIRMTAYRHGGGIVGNVAAGTLTVLRTELPGVATVTNPRPASGGTDVETIENARGRTALEYRTRNRAVTPRDYEVLTVQASARVGRARCEPLARNGVVEIRILPHVVAPSRRLDPEELVPDESLLREVAAYLDEHRTLGAVVSVGPALVRWVQVVVEVQHEPTADPQRVEQDILDALFMYVNPLVGGSLGEAGTGWPFGRTLNQGELYGVVQGVAGVQYVRLLRMYEVDVLAQDQPLGTPDLRESLPIGPGEVVASHYHIVRATRTAE